MAQNESLADKLARLRAQASPSKSTEDSTKVETEVTENEKIPEKALSLSERLALLKKTPASNVSITENKEPSSENKDPEKVSSLSIMGAALRKMPELPKDLHEKAPAEVHSLRARIWELQKESLGSNLRDCMKELQVSLLENPTAVGFMLPEDYKEMVHHVRKLVGNSVAQALSKPATKGRGGKSATQQNKEVTLDVNLDELSF